MTVLSAGRRRSWGPLHVQSQPNVLAAKRHIRNIGSLVRASAGTLRGQTNEKPAGTPPRPATIERNNKTLHRHIY
jgi:hypothetical protein